MISCKKKKPSKLCRRTYFLQTGTAPTISEITNELGPELASIVIATLEPSQRSAVGPDRVAIADEISPSHDADAIRGQIHEHILRIGGGIAHRLDGYWRRRLKQTVAVGVSPDEMDFLNFEWRQKIDIARSVERERYDELLEQMQQKLEQRFWEEKGNLHRSYAEARQLWGEFVCRKVRKQAKDMLCKIASHYRTQLEREVTHRMQIEKNRLIKEMEQIVRTAVDQQKRMDDRAIQWLVHQYEELLKFISEYNQCLDTVEMTREICKLNFGQGECHSTQVSRHSLTFDERTISHGSDIDSISMVDLEEDLHLPSSSLSKYNVFVVSQCLPEPVPEPDNAKGDHLSNTTVIEPQVGLSKSADYESIGEADSVASSLEKIVIGGLTYAQPKYYKKVYNDIFPNVAMSWETMKPSEVNDERSSKENCAQEKNLSASSQSLETIESKSIPSEPSYRESYDPIAEINNILGSKEDAPPAEESTQPDEFGELFDLSKSNEEISLVAENFATQYIRATNDDFESMFPKNSATEP
ncbi:uncharacterized protein LOC126560628 [Anopheles maculipalpis]|uniref:uncharacterized protein LOC126560628 n=1 Tax=Anopheles maculipalpis TaxID=1496333 RepID=UPI002159658A|nr:uncharacterized protein LOC126560628 [Anopheles maculipalpis]